MPSFPTLTSLSLYFPSVPFQSFLFNTYPSPSLYCPSQLLHSSVSNTSLPPLFTTLPCLFIPPFPALNFPLPFPTFPSFPFLPFQCFSSPSLSTLSYFSIPSFPILPFPTFFTYHCTLRFTYHTSLPSPFTSLSKFRTIPRHNFCLAHLIKSLILSTCFKETDHQIL